MPRGRHRQSSPLSRLLPTTACGILAIASLIAAVFTADPVVLRTLVMAASVGAFSGAVLLRLRERAGEVDLEAEVAARARDEARFEDRAAELEYQAEMAEEQVKRLERRLLAQRAQITRIESENARLLRERARAAAEKAAREAEEALRREAALRGSRPTPAAYLKAAAALRGMERRAAVGQAQRIAAPKPAAAPAAPQTSVPQTSVPQTSALDDLAARQRPETPAPAPAAAPADPPRAAPAPDWARAALPPMRPASAVLPAYLTRGGRQSRDLLRKDEGSSGTFNFFSRQEAAISTDLGDLADVVGDEAAAAQQRYDSGAVAADAPVDALPAPEHDRSAAAEDLAEEAAPEAESEAEADSELVDLTADDETEPIDVRVLRAI